MSALLEVSGLTIDIGKGKHARRVVHGVDLSVDAGECLGIVGESGSGKSLTMRALLDLLPRGAHVTGGERRYATGGGPPAAYRPVAQRGHGIAMVFQEPMTALNPTRRVGDLIADSVLVNAKQRMSRRTARAAAVGLMQEMGIPDAERRARAYSHEMSGGLRQRVMIAMALAGEPRLLICDEPTTALDVTVQDQILGLLDRLRTERGLAMLFVTHDLGVIAQISQRVAVMYDGRIVEQGNTREVLADPQHDYTTTLRDAASAIEGVRPVAKSTTPEEDLVR